MNTNKNSLPLAARRGFSLVEILVVVVIIAVLAAVAFPVAGKVIKSGNLEKNREIVTGLEQAIQRFYAEYGYHPIDAEDESELSQADLTQMLKELAGDSKKRNHKGINYLEAIPEASNGRKGLTRSGDDINGLVDSFGGTFSVILDVDYDKEIQSPLGSSTKIGDKHCLIWCYGEDKEELNDIITNWGYKAEQ